MTNETIIDKLLDKAHVCYKRVFRQQCPQLSRMLDRKQPVEINGRVFNCWSELIITTCGEIINDYCPDAEVEIELNGNNSTLSATLTDADEKILQTKIKNMIA